MINLIKNKYFILFLIVVLAGILRITNLSTIPPSLEWDEAATGYDANSILKTGRDQYGKFMPLTFRSLDDYKPPLYTYLTSISISIFGWNDFAVRFPAALLGTATIITTFAMVLIIFESYSLALLSAFFLAISPWHIMFSRLALETNSTIFFTTFGVWSFIKGIRTGKFLILSAILFGLDLFLYHNARVFVPSFGLVLICLYKKELLNKWHWVIYSALVLIIFLIPLTKIIFSIEGQMRFQGTSIFDPATSLSLLETKQMYTNWRIQDESLGFIGKIIHSEKILYITLIIKNYLSHFNPNFWVNNQENYRHHLPEMGQIYLLDLPLLLIGLYYLLKQKNHKAKILLISWFLLAPISASVTKDVPHALRSEIFLPTFQIFIAFGLINIYYKFSKNNILQKLFTVYISLSYIFLICFFAHQYFVHYSKDSSILWQYGRREAVEYSEKQKNNYNKIIVSTKLEQPHVFFLYYVKYDPVKYLSEGGTKSGGWTEQRNRFDKYEFHTFDYDKDRDGKTLFIGYPNDFPSGTETLYKTYYLDGKDALWIVK